MTLADVRVVYVPGDLVLVFDLLEDAGLFGALVNRALQGHGSAAVILGSQVDYASRTRSETVGYGEASQV